MRKQFGRGPENSNTLAAERGIASLMTDLCQHLAIPLDAATLLAGRVPLRERLAEPNYTTKGDTTKYFERLRGQSSERQAKVIARLFKEGIDGFKDGL